MILRGIAILPYYIPYVRRGNLPLEATYFGLPTTAEDEWMKANGEQGAKATEEESPALQGQII